MSSSRQVVGREMVFTTEGKPPRVLLGAGTRAKNSGALGSTATVLFGKVAKVPAAAPGPLEGQSGKPVCGSRVKSVPAVGQTSEKSPPRSAADGTFWLMVEGSDWRRHSCDQKKKVFFCRCCSGSECKPGHR